MNASESGEDRAEGIEPSAEMRALAASAPKIPIDDPRVANPERVLQFGNNFFMLFSSLRQFETTGERNAFDETFLGKAEQFGDAWQTFVRDNRDLIERIYEAIDEKEQLNELQCEDVRLLKADRSGAASEALDAAANHPLGIMAIEHHLWDKLNPLLEAAAERMSEVGIDPRQLYG